MNKIDDFEAFLTEHTPDIMCVVETWLCSDTPTSLFCPPNLKYNAVRYDRPSRGGGVALLISNMYHYSVVNIPTEFNSVEVVCVDVKFSSNSY